MAKTDGGWLPPTGISPRPMLVGAPRNALRAFNAGVSLIGMEVMAMRCHTQLQTSKIAPQNPPLCADRGALSARLVPSKNTIMEIELGRSNPKGETIFLIASELHISLDAVLYSKSGMPNAVTADVLEFFSEKDAAASAEYIQFCRQVEDLRRADKTE